LKNKNKSAKVVKMPTSDAGRVKILQCNKNFSRLGKNVIHVAVKNSWVLPSAGWLRRDDKFAKINQFCKMQRPVNPHQCGHCDEGVNKS
jgi:hypothetical protein